MRNILILAALLSFPIAAKAQLWKVLYDAISVPGGRNLSDHRYRDSDSIAVNVTLPNTATTATAAFVPTYKRTAQRLLNLALSKGGLPVAMSSPPTLVLNTSSTITGTVTTYSSSVFTFLCTVPTQISTVAALPGAGHVDKGSFRAGGLMEVSFSTDAPQLEINTYTTTDKFRIFVDDQAVSLATTTLSGTFQNTYIKLDFTTSAPRRIRYEVSGQGVFNSVKVPTNYSIWKTNTNPLRGMIVGDSYTDGLYGDGTQNQAYGYARNVGFRLGIADWFVSGESGEGYVRVGNANTRTLQVRATTDIIPYSPDYLIICEGINDAVNSTTAVQANATALYSSLLAALPNTIITVIGPWRAPSLNPPQAISDAIKAACVSQPEYGTRLQFVDTYSENWHQNAGKVGATSGSGNSNIYVGTDGIHMVQAGHDYLSQKVYNAAIKHILSLQP